MATAVRKLSSAKTGRSDADSSGQERTGPVHRLLHVEAAPNTGVSIVGDGLWTAIECAQFLGICERTLRRMRIPRIAMPSARGRRSLVRYDPAQVRDWLEAFRSRKTK